MSTTEAKIRRKNLRSLLTIILVSSLTGVAIVALSLIQRSAVLAERSKVSQESQRLLLAASAARDARHTIDGIVARAGAVEERIPETISFEKFYEAFTAQAAEHNVTVRQVNPGEPRPDGEYHYLPITIEAEASFGELHALLFSWGQSSAVMTLEELSIQSGADQRCVINLVLRLYSKQGVEPNHG